MFQPIIWNLWDKSFVPLFTKFLHMVPPQALVQLGVLIGFTVLAPIALYVLFFLSRFLKILYQFGKFAAVGSSNSFVDIGLLNLASVLGFAATVQARFGDNGFAVLAACTAFTATINSFFWNKFWTFEAGKSEEKPLVEVIKFYAVTGVVALFNGFVTSYVFNHVAHPNVSDALWTNVAKVVAILCGMLLNFVGYKFIVFVKPKNVAPVSTPSA